MRYKLTSIDTRGFKCEHVHELELEEQEIDDNLVLICPPEGYPLSDESANTLMNHLSEHVKDTKKTFLISAYKLEAFEIERVDVSPNGKKAKRSRIEVLEFSDEK